jgi:hypothetical protein
VVRSSRSGLLSGKNSSEYSRLLTTRSTEHRITEDLTYSSGTDEDVCTSNSFIIYIYYTQTSWHHYLFYRFLVQQDLNVWSTCRREISVDGCIKVIEAGKLCKLTRREHWVVRYTCRLRQMKSAWW